MKGISSTLYTYSSPLAAATNCGLFLYALPVRLFNLNCVKIFPPFWETIFTTYAIFICKAYVARTISRLLGNFDPSSPWSYAHYFPITLTNSLTQVYNIHM